MLLTAIGAGMKAAGAIYGAVQRRKAFNKMKANIQKQQNENQDWYDRRYNEDYTQRADTQRLLTLTEDSIKNRNRQAAGTAAVMGGTEESVAVAREAGNKAMSDTVSNIAAQAENYKSSIENKYMAKKDELANQMNTLEQQGAEAAAQAGQEFGNIGGALMGGK